MVYQSESSRYYKVAWTSSKSVEVVEISLEESLGDFSGTIITYPLVI